MPDIWRHLGSCRLSIVSPYFSVQVNFRSVCVVLCLALLTACSSVIRTKVNAFSEPGIDFRDVAFIAVMDPATKDAEANIASLESQLYLSTLRTALQSKGYRVISGPDLSSSEIPVYKIALSYQVSRLEDVAVENSAAYLSSTARVRRRDLGAGLIVLESAEKIPNFERRIDLVVSKYHETEGKRVYEVRARSEGRCGTMSEVFGAMLEATLREFPAPNGTLQNIAVKTPRNCK